MPLPPRQIYRETLTHYLYPKGSNNGETVQLASRDGSFTGGTPPDPLGPLRGGLGVWKPVLICYKACANSLKP
jgi:hypothetical protein